MFFDRFAKLAVEEAGYIAINIDEIGSAAGCRASDELLQKMLLGASEQSATKTFFYTPYQASRRLPVPARKFKQLKPLPRQKIALKQILRPYCLKVLILG
jgi:hypothetical protein